MSDHSLVTRAYQTGETGDDDKEGRDEPILRLVSLLHENPTHLDANPMCSRRVLLRAK